MGDHAPARFAMNLTEILGIRGLPSPVQVGVRDVWNAVDCPGSACPPTVRLDCEDPGNCTLTDTVPVHGAKLFRVWSA